MSHRKAQSMEKKIHFLLAVVLYTVFLFLIVDCNLYRKGAFVLCTFKASYMSVTLCKLVKIKKETS